jgi:hypothetical protein
MEYVVAQVNIGRLVAPLDSPQLADFVAWLDPVNAVADGAPGFVWRLQTEDGNATAIRPFDDDSMLVNMSVWRDVESLRNYVYASAHVQIMRRRREWFERMSEAYLVLWWVPRGHRPGIAEGIAKLDALQKNGPGPEAFTFRETFPPPDAPGCERPGGFADECPAG